MERTPTSIETKFLSLAGVGAFCFAAVHFSAISVAGDIFPLVHLSPHTQLFEHHFWQFVFAFTVIVLLSRGHLWSYGINSTNLKISMVYLGWLYAATILLTIGTALFDQILIPISPERFPLGIKGTVVVMLIYWMSAPVANQILFFGFGQTMLMKHWGNSLKLLWFPLPVIFSAILFTVFSTATHFVELSEYSWIATFGIGLFSGFVYWKTSSLITPMLGQAFFFGFPLFIHVLRLIFF